VSYTDLESCSGLTVESSPESFLNTHVLPNDKAKGTLRLWLSAAASNRASAAMKRLRPPSIWLLTGVYVIEEARTLAVVTREPQVSVGLGSIPIAALTGLPIGGSFDVGKSTSIRVDMVQKGPSVWAAQYMRLRVNYFWPGEDMSLSQPISLWNTFVKDGTAFNDDDPKTYIPPVTATVSAANTSVPNEIEKLTGLDKKTFWIESEVESEDGSEEGQACKEALLSGAHASLVRSKVSAAESDSALHKLKKDSTPVGPTAESLSETHDCE